MLKPLRNLSLMCVLLSFALSGTSQTAPCRQGTLADVLGTSCSVGPMTFNFQNFYNSFFAVFGVQSGTIPPSDIGFIPVLEDGRAGFRLVTNFVDETAPGGFHVIGFIYAPQAAAGFEIRRQSISLDATATSAPGGQAIVESFDTQIYPVAGFAASEDFLITTDGVLNTNQLSNDVFLTVPAFSGTASPFTGVNIQSSANGAAGARLNSATILYTFGPIVPPPPAAGLKYTDLDLPGTVNTFVSNIINSGRMVGSYQDFFGALHGYVAEPNGSFSTIDVPGAAATFADGLNERGDVVGAWDDFAGQTHGFVVKKGLLTTFDVPGAIFTAPIAINDKGQIVGFYETADFFFEGFLLDNGVFTTIDHRTAPFGPRQTEAFAINDKGTIGGEFYNAFTLRSFLQRGSESESIDVTGQGNTVIEGINNQGDAVGIFDDIQLVQHGFVRDGATFRTVDHPDGSATFPLGINSSGTIVGTYTSATGQTRSFIAEPSATHDQRPVTSAPVQTGPRPNCLDEQWQRQKGRIRGAGSCQITQ